MYVENSTKCDIILINIYERGLFMPNDEMTLEQAQERIVELTEQVEQLTQNNNDLTSQLDTLQNDNKSLRDLNQKYFNKLIAQERTPENEDKNEDEEIPTCEDFAMDFKFD